MVAPSVQVFDSLNSVWGQALKPAGCPTCKQVHLIHPEQENMLCPACGQGMLVLQTAWLPPSAPEMVVPFRAPVYQQMAVILDKFVGEVWLKADDFNSGLLSQRLRPVYWTEWLVDGQVTGSWKAEAGFDYQVKSSQESYQNNSWQSNEILETRVRWETRVGQFRRLYQNIVTPAFSQHVGRMSLIGGYDTAQAKAYAPSLIGKAAVQAPDLQPQEIWQAVEHAFVQKAEAEVQQAGQAQHIRNFSLDAAYESLNWTQLLLPLYSTYYKDDEGQTHIILINGQSGQIGGVRIASQRKGWYWAGLLASGALVILILAIISLLLGAIFLPATVIGTLLIIAAIICGICAVFPAVSPWQWNRDQRDIPRFPPQSNR
jgi:hypothetical protein